MSPYSELIFIYTQHIPLYMCKVSNRKKMKLFFNMCALCELSTMRLLMLHNKRKEEEEEQKVVQLKIGRIFYMLEKLLLCKKKVFHS